MGNIDIDEANVSPLTWAVIQGDLLRVGELLQRGDTPNITSEPITPLFAAVVFSRIFVVFSRTFIVELLIHYEADVEFAVQGISPLWQAACQGDLSLVNLLLKNGALANRVCNGVTPLWIAAQNGHLEVVQLLLKQPEVDVNFPAQMNGVGNGRTPLIAAISHGKFDVADTLINAGADVNQKCFNTSSSLYWAIKVIDDNSMDDISLVQTILRAGAKITADDISELLRGISRCKNDFLLMEAILSRYFIGYAILFDFIKTDRVSLFERFLQVHSEKFLEENLNYLFIFLLNHYKFKFARSLLSHIEQVYSSYSLPNKLGNNFDSKLLGFDFDKLTFPENTSIERQMALKQAFLQFGILLENSQQCVALLKPLDIQLAKLNLSLNFIKFEHGFTFRGLSWPAVKPELLSIIRFDGILRFFLRNQLQRYGIETQDNLYTFAGFVDTEDANKIVQEGALFKEQYLMSNALTHGLYSHYLQWYLFSRALDENIIQFKDGLSLLDVLKATVQVYHEGAPVWTPLFDHYSKVNRFYGFRAPMQLNHALMCSPECSEHLPNLQGYLLNAWRRNINKLQEFMKIQRDQSVTPIDLIIKGQLITEEFFSLLNLNLSAADIERYYNSHSRTNGYLSEETNILTKKASERFSDLSFFKREGSSANIQQQHPTPRQSI